MNLRPSSCLRALLVVSSIAALGACGGGGGGGGTPVPVPPSSSRCDAVATFTVADAAAVAGKTAGAVVGSCGLSFSHVSWTQTGGPPVSLMSARSPAISFDAPSAGTYSFAVSYQRPGLNRTETLSVNVAAPTTAPASTVTLRADQAVRKGGKASIRAWPSIAAGDSLQSLSWTQLEGPTVTLDTSDSRRAIFTAPDVSSDTLLRFRVTLRTAGGVSDSDEVMVLVENVAPAPADPNNSGSHVFSDLHVSRVYPYKTFGAFAASLVRCTYDPALQFSGAGKNLCSLSDLPFLHQTTNGAVPTVAQIMDRVAVSHDWMGEVFEQFLNSPAASDDLKRLFNGVTAIVIGAHVRPSFYYALTGAIYLDADNFWLTAAQRDVIDEAPDFRSDFGRDLQFSAPWRYAFNNQNIFVNFDPASRIGRDLSYLLNEAGWLLYHELGHASDFMPPAARVNLNPGISAWDSIAPRFSASQLPSDALTAAAPLQSAEMRALARVMFLDGPAANAGTLVNGIPYGTLTGYTAQQVGAFFAADRASDTYNYSTSREDAAMLFEEFMLARNHGFRRDVAITDKIGPSTSSNNLIVRWGQRGRVGESQVRPRVQQIVQALAPWVLQADPNAVANLPAPIAMRAGDSWAANLCVPVACAPAPGPVQALGRGLGGTDFAADRALLQRALRGPLFAGATGMGAHWTPNERILRRLGEDARRGR